MPRSIGGTETVIGYITNVSNENKKRKYFIKFTMLSEDNKTVDGWVFSSISGILSTPLGLALTNAFKTKTGIQLWGSAEIQADSTTFRMQGWSKFQPVNIPFQLVTESDELLNIEQSLMNMDLNSIRVSIIDIRPPETYDNHGFTKSLSFILIGDESGTTYLGAVDLPSDILELEKTYDISKVRKKRINGSIILSTTIDTHISLSNLNITPNVDNVQVTLAIDLTDIKSIESKIMEVGEIRRLSICTTCSNELQEVVGATALVFCTKCLRHALKKNINLTISTNLMINNEQENVILFINKEIFMKVLQILHIDVDMNDTDLCIALLSEQKLMFKFSEFRKEIIDVTKLQ